MQSSRRRPCWPPLQPHSPRRHRSRRHDLQRLAGRQRAWGDILNVRAYPSSTSQKQAGYPNGTVLAMTGPLHRRAQPLQHRPSAAGPAGARRALPLVRGLARSASRRRLRHRLGLWPLHRSALIAKGLRPGGLSPSRRPRRGRSCNSAGPSAAVRRERRGRDGRRNRRSGFRCASSGERSTCSAIAPSSTGAKKLGQPEPESYLVSERNSGRFRSRRSDRGRVPCCPTRAREGALGAVRA
jgi:hypothetical protein